jgi:hypothetical protein
MQVLAGTGVLAAGGWPLAGEAAVWPRNLWADPRFADHPFRSASPRAIPRPMAS